MSNERFIKQVTLTGVDTRTDYWALYDLSRKYPFVEWGILLSLNSEGAPRFPTRAWIKDFFEGKPAHVQTSGHLCGSWVRDIVNGGHLYLRSHPEFAWRFDRIQLNFHGIAHHGHKADFQRSVFALSLPFNRPIIFQIDGVNHGLYEDTLKWGVIEKAQALHDVSGGAGLLPDEWPLPLGSYCGYAGGLSPDNLESQIEAIKTRIRQEEGGIPRIWIDAETNLRTTDSMEDYFDLEKADRFLGIASQYVI